MTNEYILALCKSIGVSNVNQFEILDKLLFDRFSGINKIPENIFIDIMNYLSTWLVFDWVNELGYKDLNNMCIELIRTSSTSLFGESAQFHQTSLGLRIFHQGHTYFVPITDEVKVISVEWFSSGFYYIDGVSDVYVLYEKLSLCITPSSVMKYSKVKDKLVGAISPRELAMQLSRHNCGSDMLSLYFKSDDTRIKTEAYQYMRTSWNRGERYYLEDKSDIISYKYLKNRGIHSVCLLRDYADTNGVADDALILGSCISNILEGVLELDDFTFIDKPDYLPESCYGIKFNTFAKVDNKIIGYGDIGSMMYIEDLHIYVVIRGD